jgi:hypothetical protein
MANITPPTGALNAVLQHTKVTHQQQHQGLDQDIDPTYTCKASSAEKGSCLVADCVVKSWVALQWRLLTTPHIQRHMPPGP